MYITKKHLSRRTLLRGMGVSLALPLLDSMVPAQTPLSKTAACRSPVSPASKLCTARPAARWMASNKHYWSPEKVGADFEFTQTLKPFEPFRDYITVVSGTDLIPATAHSPKEEGADHFRSSAAFLTAAHPKMTEGADIFCGTSIDQLYAQQFGQDTPLPSIQLCIESLDGSGACDYGYACVYADTISWASPTSSAADDARSAHGVRDACSATAARRRSGRRAQQTNGSILDWISHSVTRLQKGLGAERSGPLSILISKMFARSSGAFSESRNTTPAAKRARCRPRPSACPIPYDEHVKLMFDLQALAFMTNMTRVSAFKMSRDVNQRVYPESGVKTPFHSCSHHGESPARIAEFAKINLYHASLVPYFLEKLRDTPDGDGNLLDHSMVLYGSPMGDSNAHNHKRLPILAGGQGQRRAQRQSARQARTTERHWRTCC